MIVSSANAMAEHVRQCFAQLEAAGPPPVTELRYVNDYTLLVAVVLSAQATDVGVNKATEALFRTVQTPEAMLQLGEAGLREHVRSIGLYQTKAANIIALSRLLIERHGGRVPDNRAALEALPGVGGKTAGVVLNVAFGHATLPVDTHVFRVAHRLGWSDASTPTKTEAQLLQRIPAELLSHAHHRLILHGRYVCKARAPQCHRCVLQVLCPKLGIA